MYAVTDIAPSSLRETVRFSFFDILFVRIFLSLPRLAGSPTSVVIKQNAPIETLFWLYTFGYMCVVDKEINFFLFFGIISGMSMFPVDKEINVLFLFFWHHF